jgi:Tfp pilus assembly PilM family ATPase
MASQLAERRSIPLVEARELIAAFDLTVQPAPEPLAQSVVAEAEAELEPHPEPQSLVDPEAPTAIVDEAAPDEVRTVLEGGIREIAGEVRNSLDFHRSQEGGGEVSRVVLSGAALDLSGFAEALQEQLGIQVERESVQIDEQQLGGVSAHRLAIAAGLAVEEAPR